MVQQFGESLYVPPRAALATIRYASERILSYL